MKYLLDYIKEWAEVFPTQSKIWSLAEQQSQDQIEEEEDETKSEFQNVYEFLVKEHVTFPGKELFPVKQKPVEIRRSEIPNIRQSKRLNYSEEKKIASAR